MNDFDLSIFNSAEACAFVLSPAGDVRHANDTARARLALGPPGAMEGRRWAALWPEADRGLIDHAVRRAAEGAPVAFEVVCPARDGARTWYDLRLTPMVGAAGTVESLLAVMSDLTETRGTPAPD